VDRFTVIAVPEGTPGASGLSQQLRAVLNGGIGVERTLSESVSVYGAFHTDYSASTGDVRQNVAISDWDLYHFSGGMSFRFRDNRFTLGASWAVGSRNRPLDTPIPPGDVPVPALGQDISVHYTKVTFLLGFVFGI
jgi:long-subunit fatty acid transport protein